MAVVHHDNCISAALARPGVAAMSTEPSLPNAGEPTRRFGAAPFPAVRWSSSPDRAIVRPAARLAGSGSIAPAWPSAAVNKPVSDGAWLRGF